MAGSSKASKMRMLVMDREDADAFSRSLREAYPGVRFLPFEYWMRREGKRTVKQEPLNLALHYYESLGDPEEFHFLVWVEPEDWHPDWTGPNENGIWYVTNEPRLQFVFHRSDVPPDWDSDMRDGRVWAYYEKGDDEHRLFLNHVWRITTKLTTNYLQHVDRDTKIPTGPPSRPNLWAGLHALEWCREDPQRTLASDWRPVADGNDSLA